MAKILIIEDDQSMREIMAELLALDNYETVLAADGDVGVETYRQEHPDLVITDLIMPNKDGVMVVQELKEEFPEARIMVISGTQDLSKFSEAVKFNANRILTKPFETDQLLDAVAQLIDERAHTNTAYQHSHYPTH
ncbi:MAG: response regulator [Candidatus Hydrogenedentota bacterium]|nr:MAG: response regulator [Candidatus Hydrogenedentota bacterium]